MRKPTFLLLSFVALIIITACSGSGTKVITPTDGENDILKKRGNDIAMSLVKTLKSEVKNSIEKDGVSGAINICNEKAMPLTHEIEKQYGNTVSIKRTSFKYRNQENAPDEFETLALNHFDVLSSQQMEIPAFYTQKVISEGDTTFYYYKPMKTEMLCLLCHGNESAISPEVKNMLSELYPEDKATGYKEGDFRGLIRVKFTSL